MYFFFIKVFKWEHTFASESTIKLTCRWKDVTEWKNHRRVSCDATLVLVHQSNYKKEKNRQNNQTKFFKSMPNLILKKNCSRWRMGSWTKCSVTCGIGIHTRDYECVQEVNSLLTVRVSDGACLESKSPPDNETCIMPACDNTKEIEIPKISKITPRWDVSEWSPVIKNRNSKIPELFFF